MTLNMTAFVKIRRQSFMVAYNVTRVYAVADLRAAHFSTDAEDYAMQKPRNKHRTRN